MKMSTNENESMDIRLYANRRSNLVNIRLNNIVYYNDEINL